MELVEGEDLSARIARGPVPLSEVLPIARQIADAVEAAHEQGIIHRDLKPGNIKLRADGTVKVLDFGLAKAVAGPEGSSSGGGAMNSPTLTARATQMGMIIGTAAYMAPEQAKGRPVDKRADIWAFGVVLYEMLTGRRAFEGEDISTTLAAVLMRDPEFAALPVDTPPALMALVRRCLERDPKQRLRDIGEARVLLNDPEAMRGGPPTGVPVPAARSASARPAWIVAGAAGLAALVFAGLWVAGPATPDTNARLEVSLEPPPGTSVGVAFALSPDGNRLVLQAVDDETGVPALWLRELANGTPGRIGGTEGADMPFWSPDGREVAFFAEGKLKRVDLEGGPPQVICDAPSPRGGAWGPDGRIVFSGAFRLGLNIVDASGGVPAVLTELDAARSEKSHRWPVFLPDGEHLLFVAQTGEGGVKDDSSTIEALSVTTGERTRLVTANSSPLYAPSGFLLFWREGALRAQAFDARSLTVSGPVTTVATSVLFDSNELAHASVSRDGKLVYQVGVGASLSNIVVVDRSGRPLRTVAESVLTEGGLALSPDGTRVAVALTTQSARDQDIWIYDLQRSTSGPLTFDEGPDTSPFWSADGAALYYINTRVDDGIVFRRAADGSGEAEQVAVNPTGAGFRLRGISRDGHWLLNAIVADATSTDLIRFDIESRESTPLVDTPFNEQDGALSPDNRWLAYSSDQTGRAEVFVRSLSTDAGRWQVSTEGGSFPTWRADGRELYYLTPRRELVAVAVEADAAFRTAAPRVLFSALVDVNTELGGGMSYAPFPDGQRFVVDVLTERPTTLLTLVTNWLAPSTPAR
jgi:Tol biopolymer transport system component